MNGKTCFAIALGTCAVVGLPAAAATVTTQTTGIAGLVTSGDLLETSLDTVVIGGDGNFDSRTQGTTERDIRALGEPSLRNGIFESVNTTGGGDPLHRGDALIENGEDVSYFLDLAASAAGYNIDTIALFSNWGAGEGRDDILVTIDFSLVGDPTNFNQNLVTDEFFEPVFDSGDAEGTTQGMLRISDIGATGIAAVRFTFPAGQENNAVGYSEIDVIGTPVPEPTSVALLALGGLMALKRRRQG